VFRFLPMNLETPGHENSEAQRTDSPTHKQVSQSEPPLSSTATGFQPPPSPPRHNTDAHESQEPEDWRKNLTLGVEIVGLCVLVVYTCFAGCQWRVANDTLTEIRNSKADTQKLIDAAGKQADAATKNAAAAEKFAGSADGINTETKLAVDKFGQMAKASRESIRTIQETAKKALDASIDASRLDQRAWVGVEAVDVKDGLITVILKNTGKTPAIHIAFYWLATYSEDPTEYSRIPEFHGGMFVDYDEWLKYWNNDRRKRGTTEWPESPSERLRFDDQVLAPGVTSAHTHSFPVKRFLLGKIT
jgi:hypothetical protein